MQVLKSETILQERYVIEGLLGKGGMGEVYKAYHIRLQSHFAIKKRQPHQNFCFDEEQEEENRLAFENEAKLLASLDHPYMPKVTDYFSEQGSEFLVMEYIEGEDLSVQLAERLRKKQGPFAYGDVLRWTEQLLKVLDYLHHAPNPILHRDIKPGNLKLKAGDIMLLDFGLSKGFTDHLTRSGNDISIGGYSPPYAPPEQMDGQADTPLLPCSDLFSLAATMYHLLTGALPLTARARRRVTLPPINDVLSDHQLPTTPLWFAELLTSALELDASKRPASAADMLGEIVSRKTGRMTRPFGWNPDDDEDELARRQREEEERLRRQREEEERLRRQREEEERLRRQRETVRVEIPFPALPASPADMPTTPSAYRPTAPNWQRRLMMLALLFMLAGVVAVAWAWWQKEPTTPAITPPTTPGTNRNGVVDPPRPRPPNHNGNTAPTGKK